MGSPAVVGDGSADYGSGLILGNDQGQHSLPSHPAVERHGEGTSTPELADFIRILTEASIARVTTTGDDQYNTGGLQSFEAKTLDQLVDELLDEVYDIQSYLAMIAIKVIALRERAR